MRAKRVEGEEERRGGGGLEPKSLWTTNGPNQYPLQISIFPTTNLNLGPGGGGLLLVWLSAVLMHPWSRVGVPSSRAGSYWFGHWTPSVPTEFRDTENDPCRAFFYDFCTMLAWRLVLLVVLLQMDCQPAMNSLRAVPGQLWTFETCELQAVQTLVCKSLTQVVFVFGMFHVA